jgi:AraC-like DNA-binding protein
LPEIFEAELGRRAVQRANRAAGIDFEAIADRHAFVPQAAIGRYVDAAARIAGEARFGLLLTPTRDIAFYGRWGDYLLQSPTLGEAIDRCLKTLGYHSVGDRIALRLDGDEAHFLYGFGMAGRTGYDHLAPAAAGVLLSLCRHYAPPGWQPLRIELDIAKPRNDMPFEDLFRCPVVFDAPTVAVVFDRHFLAATARRRSARVVTIEDVARFTGGGAPRDLPEIVAEQIRLQVLSGTSSIDDVARAMDTSVRSLQRTLNRMGTDFRSLTNQARVARAMELLRHGGVSVTEIAFDLGYSAPASFARAFRNVTGVSPREFRNLARDQL